MTIAPPPEIDLDDATEVVDVQVDCRIAFAVDSGVHEDGVEPLEKRERFVVRAFDLVLARDVADGAADPAVG
jgi:hypothetical protein